MKKKIFQCNIQFSVIKLIEFKLALEKTLCCKVTKPDYVMLIEAALMLIENLLDNCGHCTPSPRKS